MPRGFSQDKPKLLRREQPWRWAKEDEESEALAWLRMTGNFTKDEEKDKPYFDDLDDLDHLDE